MPAGEKLTPIWPSESTRDEKINIAIHYQIERLKEDSGFNPAIGKSINKWLESGSDGFFQTKEGSLHWSRHCLECVPNDSRKISVILSNIDNKHIIDAWPHIQEFIVDKQSNYKDILRHFVAAYFDKSADVPCLKSYLEGWARTGFRELFDATLWLWLNSRRLSGPGAFKELLKGHGIDGLTMFDNNDSPMTSMSLAAIFFSFEEEDQQGVPFFVELLADCRDLDHIHMRVGGREFSLPTVIKFAFGSNPTPKMKALKFRFSSHFEAIENLEIASQISKELKK